MRSYFVINLFGNINYFNYFSFFWFLFKFIKSPQCKNLYLINLSHNPIQTHNNNLKNKSSLYFFLRILKINHSNLRKYIKTLLKIISTISITNISLIIHLEIIILSMLKFTNNSYHKKALISNNHKYLHFIQTIIFLNWVNLDSFGLKLKNIRKDMFRLYNNLPFYSSTTYLQNLAIFQTFNGTLLFSLNFYKKLE